MLRLRALCFCLLSFSLWSPITTHAQEAQGAAATVDAREAFRRGEAAYSAGNYEVAIREWNSAYAVDPRPRIQFNLSQAYERTGELEKAVEALKKFLDSADPDDPMYSDANARHAALQQRIASTGVLVKGGSEGGQIFVDDQEWGRTPRPDKITLTPGSHVIVVRWPDRPEFRTNVFVPAGQVIEVQVHEQGPQAAPTTGSQGTQVSASTDDLKKDRKLLWYVLGGSTAAVGTGLLIYGIVRNGDKVDCGGNIYCPDPSQADSVKTQSIAGLAVGGTLMAAGAALIVVGALTGNSGGEQQAKTQCGVGYASAACRFRF